MLHTIKRTGKRDNTTIKCLLFFIPWSRKGPKMAPPAFTMVEGSTVTRKPSRSMQESYRRSAKYFIAFKYLKRDIKLSGYLDAKHTVLFIKAPN